MKEDKYPDLTMTEEEQSLANVVVEAANRSRSRGGVAYFAGEDINLVGFGAMTWHEDIDDLLSEEEWRSAIEGMGRCHDEKCSNIHAPLSIECRSPLTLGVAMLSVISVVNDQLGIKGELLEDGGHCWTWRLPDFTVMGRSEFSIAFAPEGDKLWLNAGLAGLGREH